MKGAALGLVAAILATPALAPADPPPASDSYETLLGDVETESGYNNVLYLLDEAAKHPVNLLAADGAELAKLPGVSPGLAREIVNLRTAGGLKSLEDISTLPGANDRLVEALRPFVVIQPVEKRPLPVKTMLRLRVIGSPPTSRIIGNKTNVACEIATGSFGAGLVVDKDKDERRLNDFQACYVEKTWGRSTVTVGNFLVTSGHGLVFSDAYGESPSTADPWRIGRGAFGVRTSTAARENSFLRGAAVALAGKAWDLCVVGSSADFDVALDAGGRVTSLNEAGTHVTASEVKGRDALREDLAGLVCRARHAGLRATASLEAARLSRAFAFDVLDWPAHVTRIAGGLDLAYEQDDAVVFGEGALGAKGSAALAGLAVRRPHTDVLLVGRRYAPEYASLHSAPFAFYSGLGKGERGLFTLIKFKPAANGELAISTDVHQELRADGALRPHGSETNLDLAIDSGPFTLALGEKLATSEDPPSASAALRDSVGTEETTRLRSRLDVGYAPRRGISFRARYEALTATEAEAGATTWATSDVLRFDLTLAAFKPFKLDAGCYVFSVANWAARIYQYEAGVPYYPTLELLKSDGSRWYAAVSWEARRLGKLAAKYGRTRYQDGEGHSEMLASFSLKM